MPELTLTKEERTWLVSRIQDHFSDELDQEIGNMDAEFLIDFFAKTAGPLFYNSGVRDAQTLLTRKLEDVTDEFYALEKPFRDLR